MGSQIRERVRVLVKDMKKVLLGGSFSRKMYNYSMEFVYIGFGWLLGLLAPALTKRIVDHYEKQNLEKIIFNDLKDLKKRLGSIPYLVYPKHGKLNQDIFNWIKKNSSIDFDTGLKQLAEQGLTETQIINHLNITGKQDVTTTYFKKVNLFATDSHLTKLSLIENSLMEKILEIKFHAQALNEDIDSFRDDLKMTFMPGITVENHRIVSAEINKKSLMIAKKSMFIVDKINEILSSREGSTGN